MAQPGYDFLLGLTDSRYRLSMVVGRRAAQLKTGARPLLAPEAMPAASSNTVSVAMAELRAGAPIVWGTDLPSEEELAGFRVKVPRPEPTDD